MSPENLLGGPEPTMLSTDDHSAVVKLLAAGSSPAEAAAAFPAVSLGWALLAAEAWDRQATVESYAYARTGYHRGLDALRRAGWRGHGPVPFSHEANRGFLMSLHALGRAAEAIGEQDEAARCTQFLNDCDPTAAEALNS